MRLSKKSLCFNSRRALCQRLEAVRPVLQKRVVVQVLLEDDVDDRHGEDPVRTGWAKGAGESRVMFHHAFRNALIPVITLFGGPVAGLVGGSVVIENMFNIPGIGVDLNTPSWGYLLTSQGRSKMYTAPWIGLAPGIAITIMVFAAAMFGDGVRDILDPRLKGGMGSFSRKKIRKLAEKYLRRKEKTAEAPTEA